MNPLFFALAAATAFAAAPRFTLEQVMSKPFASQLTPGPGGRVAWTVNLLGARNIWIAEAPAYRGRALTSFTGDDGRDIGELHWMPDGKAVVFVRGGDLEHPRSEFPNALSLPLGAEQGVWLATLDGAVRKLADGESAVPLNANRVLLIKGGEIWSIGLAATDNPVLVAKPRGGAQSLSPSPDGNRVAFTNSRQDHAFIGVYDFAARSVRYLDASVDTDLSPVWSPDSKSLAFIRIAAQSQWIGGPLRASADPWSVRVADAATGRGREVWKALPGPGSAFRSLASDSLFWADADRLVFPWERDGWTHLYSVAAKGGDAALLTPGDFEVEHAAVATDRRSMVYSSNQNDIDRRHIWRVGVEPGAQPVALTSGAGIEWSPASLDGRAVAFLRSDARLPARAALRMESSAERDLAPDLTPRDFPAAALVEPQPVIFPAADGMIIHGQLFVPPDGAAKRPALIFFHGGSRRQMLLGWHPMYYYNNAYALNQYLASLGYLVLSINYRSGTGYGLDFREAVNYGLAGASEYNDVIGAGLYLRTRTDVDPKRIGLWGGSYGGYLTALGLARASDLFAAGVDFHGVHDWSKLRSFEPGSAEARTAFESSPMASVKTWRSPVLLIHGDDDRNVPFAQTVRLVEALRARNVEFEELILPDEIHDFLTHGHWVEAYRATVDFLGRKLK